MTLLIPDILGPRGERLVPSDADTSELVPIPVSTPRKGRLVVIEDAQDGSGATLRKLTHGEHVDLTRRLIRIMLFSTYVDWLAVDYTEALTELARIQTRLAALAEAKPERAREILEEIFGHDGQLRAYTNKKRPDTERDLYRLCTVLVDRYILALEGAFDLSELFVVKYVQRTPREYQPYSWVDKMRMYCQVPPTRVREQVPLARRTNEYQFSMELPSGFYCFAQEVVYAHAPTGGRPSMRLGESDRLPHFVTRSGGDTSAVGTRGVPRMANVYIHGGSSSANRLDISVTAYEIPFGSIGEALVVSLITFLTIAATLVTQLYLGNLSQGYPSLLVALIAAGSAAGGGILRTAPSQDVSMTARVVKFGSLLVAYLFAVWLLIAAAKDVPAVDWASRFLALWATGGGYLLLAASAAILATALKRLFGTLKNYDGARSNRRERIGEMSP